MAIAINEISIKNKFGKALQAKRFQAIAFNAASARVVAAQNNLLNEYDKSEIAQELNEGAGAKSKILSYGNLYSFLGFNLGDRPAEDLREYIQANIKLIPEAKFRNNIDKNRVFYEFPVQYPTLKDIYENDKFQTPDNWAGSRSWPSLIEDGIGTFASYIYHEFFMTDKSRSKTGLQRETPREGVTDKVLKIKWISKLLDNFKSRIRGKNTND